MGLYKFGMHGDQTFQFCLYSRITNHTHWINYSYLQTCVCSNRLLVQEGIYDSFLESFSQQVAGLKVGDGFEADTSQGPLINIQAVEKVHLKIV